FRSERSWHEATEARRRTEESGSTGVASRRAWPDRMDTRTMCRGVGSRIHSSPVTLAGPLRRPAVEPPARLLRSFPFVFGPFVSMVFDRFLRILRDLGSLGRSENAFKAGFITGADTQVGPYNTIVKSICRRSA